MCRSTAGTATKNWTQLSRPTERQVPLASTSSHLQVSHDKVSRSDTGALVVPAPFFFIFVRTPRRKIQRRSTQPQQAGSP